MEKLSFDPFARAIDKQWSLMQAAGILVRVDINPDELWKHYMASFPEGTNKMFRERREYECNCCMGFIRKVAGVVAIGQHGVMSVWDVLVPGYHQEVANKMSALVKALPFSDYYLHDENMVGKNQTPDFHQPDLIWKHFSVEIPKHYVKATHEIPSTLGEWRTTKEVFKRGLDEFTIDACEAVLELIIQGSLYRGNEHQAAIEGFIKVKKEYDAITDDAQREIWVWTESKRIGKAARFRGSLISTLIQDVSEGKELDQAVGAFEFKAYNYKRPTALVTPAQVKVFKANLKEAGYDDSIQRRMARPTDFSASDLLFSAKVDKSLDVFGDMLADVKNKTPKNLSKTEEVSAEKFFADILPQATSIEILLENRLIGNLMTMVAPVRNDDPNILKWDNRMSWAYNGDVTDSIKERVKAAGGVIEAFARVTGAWFNFDDLDIAVVEPNNHRIYFGNMRSPYTGGHLDVDMNRAANHSRAPVENIVWKDKTKMTKGRYRVEMKNFNRRERTDVGFEIQLEFPGTIINMSYPKAVGDSEVVHVCDFIFDGENFTLENVHKDIKMSQSSQDVWGLKTETFVPATMVMNSPNFWGENAHGNKHTFFILEGAKNPEPVRGFYNEYLLPDLHKFRKEFEILGAMTKAVSTDNQVSGLGFSETKRESVTVRVTGKTNRVFTVKF